MCRGLPAFLGKTKEWLYFGAKHSEALILDSVLGGFQWYYEFTSVVNSISHCRFPQDVIANCKTVPL